MLRINFFFQAEDGIRDIGVTGVQTCALPICTSKDIFEVVIPKSRWVVFECDNYEIDKVRDVYSKFLQEWLPFSGYEWAKLPDIEVYPLDSNTKKFEIWIAIQEKGSGGYEDSRISRV